MSDIRDAVIAALKEAKEPARAAQIAEQLGVDAKEVNRVFNTLKKEGVIHSPKRCCYALVK